MAIKESRLLTSEQPPTTDPVALSEYLTRQVYILNGIIRELNKRLQELEDA